MTSNTPRDTRRSSAFANSHPARDAIFEKLRKEPNTWGELSQHASANSARQIKARLKRSHRDFEFRVQTDEDGATLFALYPDAFPDGDQ